MDEQVTEMIKEMTTRAALAGVEPTENLEKIAKARVRMHLDISVCPCAAQDTDRGCISAKCLREINEEGICHCTAFKKKIQ